jgi:RNA polymerase sigma-70 factor (ECF subfamily)
METEFIEAVAEEIDRRSEELEQKAQLLQGCVERLPEAHRAALAWRYEEGLGVEEIASRSRRSVEAVYRLLSRIRAALVECVQHARREDSRG